MRNLLAAIAVMLASGAAGQELWWGGSVEAGAAMPYKTGAKVYNLGSGSATAPLLLSSAGRYVWAEAPFSFRIADNGPATEPKIELVEGGKTLKEAFLTAAKRHFPADGALPDTTFFAVPQWNDWIELQYDQSQEAILRYARGVIDNGFEPGVLMIDDNWQRYYGNFDFRAERFPDPRGMIDELHRMGFKVMVWICPFVSPDSAEYRELRAKGFLLPGTISWWNGLSACYDLTNPKAKEHFAAQLRSVQQRYGVDGFKFDAGDSSFYAPAAGVRGVEQTRAWMELGLSFPLNEYRAGWGMAGRPIVMRLGDKDHSWRALRALIPEMTAVGLMGYPFACPDMVGGGQVASFGPGAVVNEELVVRSAQVHALMPMMQFSVAPWRVLSADNLALVREAARLHSRFAPYIMECARHAARTGEPIVRAMEYEFPHAGMAECNDQFMLGDRYLVAPMVHAGASRTVVLPAGRWRDDGGKVHRGGRSITIDVPLARLPYFEKL